MLLHYEVMELLVRAYPRSERKWPPAVNAEATANSRLSSSTFHWDAEHGYVSRWGSQVFAMYVLGFKLYLHPQSRSSFLTTLACCKRAFLVKPIEANSGLQKEVNSVMVPSVKSLGVIMDASLSMEDQVAKMAKMAFLQLHQFR